MPKNKAKNSATLIFYFPKGEVISLINFFLSNNAIPASAELQLDSKYSVVRLPV